MREQFHYVAQLQREDGQIVDRQISVYWSPDKIDPSIIPLTAAAEQTYETKVKHVGLSAYTPEF